MHELLAECVPPGVVNLVNGGVDVVNGLCEHPDVRGVSFVGSTPVARHVYRTASHAGKRVQALGGAKNFIVVMPDADLDKSIGIVSESCYGCAGERCLAGSIVVTVGGASQHAAVRERLVAAAKAIRVGDGLEPGVTMGPVIREAARERVVSYVEKGLAEGAELVLDGRGHTVKGRENGFFLGATIFDRVSPKSSIGREEIFGPVLSLMNVPDLPRRSRSSTTTRRRTRRPSSRSSGKSARTFASQAPPAMVGVNVGVAAPMSFFPFGGLEGELLRRREGARPRRHRVLHGPESGHREVVLGEKTREGPLEGKESERGRERMRKVTVGLIQTHNPVSDPRASLAKVQKAAMDLHLKLLNEAGKAGRADPLPAGDLHRAVLLRRAGRAVVRRDRGDPRRPDDELMRELAKKHEMVIVVPIYEEESTGVYYNTAAVIDADGTYLGKYRKNHIPHASPASGRSSTSSPATSATRSSRRAYATGRRLHLLRPPLPRGRARARARTVPRSSSIRRRPSPGLSRVPLEARAAGRTRSRTATSSARSIASAPKRRGTSASSTARATSATRAARSSPRRASDKDELLVARPGPRHDRRGAHDLAVLPRPAAGDLRRARRPLTLARLAAAHPSSSSRRFFSSPLLPSRRFPLEPDTSLRKVCP